MATIHAQVPNDGDMQKMHDIIDGIEKDVYRETGIHLVIHMDPQEVHDKRFFKYKSVVKGIVKKLDPDAAVHGFNAKFDKNEINLVFDVTVAHSYTQEEEETLSENIKKELAKTNPQVKCDITVEHGFI